MVNRSFTLSFLTLVAVGSFALTSKAHHRQPVEFEKKAYSQLSQQYKASKRAPSLDRVRGAQALYCQMRDPSSVVERYRLYGMWLLAGTYKGQFYTLSLGSPSARSGEYYADTENYYFADGHATMWGNFKFSIEHRDLKSSVLLRRYLETVAYGFYTTRLKAGANGKLIMLIQNPKSGQNYAYCESIVRIKHVEDFPGYCEFDPTNPEGC